MKPLEWAVGSPAGPHPASILVRASTGPDRGQAEAHTWNTLDNGIWAPYLGKHLATISLVRLACKWDALIGGAAGVVEAGVNAYITPDYNAVCYLLTRIKTKVP